jgi:hypothetical protein
VSSLCYPHAKIIPFDSCFCQESEKVIEEIDILECVEENTLPDYQFVYG